MTEFLLNKNAFHETEALTLKELEITSPAMSLGSHVAFPLTRGAAVCGCDLAVTLIADDLTGSFNIIQSNLTSLNPTKQASS